MPFGVGAHGGRTNSEGCHNNSKTGQYECHGAKVKVKVSKTETKTSSRSTVRAKARDYNCSDFIFWSEAQDAFERAGGPLIDPYDLDRDSDGIACESLK